MMRRALTTIAVVLLAGCATGPDYERPAVPLPENWQAPVADAADLVNSDWWKAFGDEHLDRLIDAALDANKDLMIAAARTEQYAARLRGSEAAKYPTVGYSAGASRELRSQERPNGLRPGQSPTLSNYELGGDVSWELDLWGRVRRANEAARAELLATQEARRGVMLTVVADVASAYINLLQLDRQRELARQKLQVRRLALALMDEKRKGGSATKLDVEVLRAAVEEQASALPAIEREIRSTELGLCLLLGRNPGPIERRSLDNLKALQLPAGVPADVLTRRPDVAAAEQAMVAANARIGVAKTAYFPTLSLTAAIGLAADDLKWLFAETARTGSLGAALAGTVFDGGKTAASVREAEALRTETQTQFLKQVQTALVEVEDALSARQRADERETVIARRLQALASARDLVIARQQGGQSGKFEVYDIELVLRDAQIAEAEGRRDTLLSLVAVYKAMGGGWMLEQEQRRAPAPTDMQAQVKTQEEAKE